TVHAYLNRCAHVPVELDWMEGNFFDYSGLYLTCSTHGAAYLPDTGHCIAGPCKGRRLVPVMIEENNGQIWLKE
ncbi:MAG: Rieske (2Fe-2S) protein, partial [Betaproteobacteria bacterium]|nr:Rieske (2Fe-2S) protein [Betaproteobacteria bacterium]